METKNVSIERLKRRIRDGGTAATQLAKSIATATTSFVSYHCSCTAERMLCAGAIVILVHLMVARLAAPLTFEWERFTFATFALFTVNSWYLQAAIVFILASVAYVHLRDAFRAIPETKAEIKARMGRMRTKIAEIRNRYMNPTTQSQPTKDTDDKR